MSTTDPKHLDNRPLKEKAKSVLKKLREAGFETYFAGGCVRDQLMGRAAKDYDIATQATPDEVVALFPKTIAIGAQFGVIQVRYGGEGFEVATFRTDTGYSDGRRPDAVQYATAREDVERRDFTINGLLYDPIEDTVLDFVSGQEDLANKQIRAIGEAQKRFEEDRLRMLRAVRFAARFGFHIHPETQAAVRKNAAEIGDVSPERIREELFRIFSEGGATQGLQLLVDLGLFRNVFQVSEETALSRLPIVSQLTPGSAISVFALLLYGAEKDSIETFARKWTFSNHERKELVAIVEGLQTLAKGSLEDVLFTKKLLRRPSWELCVPIAEGLQHLNQLTGPPVQKLVELKNQFSDHELSPPPLIRGNDLAALGVQPGPHFKEVLELIHNQQLLNTIQTRDAALTFAQDFFASRESSD